MPKQTELKNYIKKVRKITIKDAAKELGRHHKYLGTIANGAKAGGGLAYKISEWSKGHVSISSLIKPL